MLTHLWRSLLKPFRTRTITRRPRQARLGLEMLEDRLVMSAATHLAIVQQPTDTFVSGRIQPGVIVELLDQNNKLVMNGTDPVTVALGANSSGATLTGTTTVAAVGGIAQFNDLSISTTGTGYTLVATDPNLGAPSIGLSIAGARGGEIAVQHLSVGATATNGVPSFSSINLSIAASAADPELLGYLVRNKTLDPVTLHVRDASGQEYLTYTLTGATITDLSSSLSAGSANDNLELSFTQLSESYRPTNANGSLGTAVEFNYDIANRAVLGAPALAIQPAASTPALGLSFGGITGEIAINAFAAGEVKSSTGTSFNNFNVALQGSIADPGLLAALVQNQQIGTATIHVRNTAGQEYMTYTISGVTVNSLQTSLTGDSTSDSLRLGFTQVSVAYFPITAPATDPASTPTTNSGSIDVSTQFAVVPPDTSAAPGQSPVPANTSNQPAAAPPQSSNSNAGQPSAPANNSNPPAAAPPEMRNSDTSQPSAPANTSTQPAAVPAQTSNSNQDQTIPPNTTGDTASLSLSTVPGTPVNLDTFTYDVTTDTVVDIPTVPPIPAAATPLPMSLSVSGITGEIAVTSFNLSDSVQADGLTHISDFNLTLPASAADPALLQALAKNGRFIEIRLHVRNTSGQEYLTYKLTDAHLTSLQTNASGNQLNDQISFDFSKLDEMYHLTNADGSLGFANQVEVNVPDRIVEATPTLSVPSAAAPPALGLSFSGIAGEIALDSAQESAMSNGILSYAPFQVDFQSNVLEPVLLAALEASSSFTTATIHVRNSAGIEYQTVTLGNATITSLSVNSRGDDALAFNFETFSDSFPDPANPKTPLALVDFNALTGKTAGKLVLPATSSPPSLGITFDNTTGELPILAYSTLDTTSGALPNFGAFQFIVESGISEPGLLALLGSSAKENGSAIIHVRNAAGQEYLTYTLANYTMQSVTTESDAFAPTDSFTLGFSTITESYRPTNPDGTLGTAIVFSYDVPNRKVLAAPPLSIEPAVSPPSIGLSFSGIPGEIAVNSLSQDDATSTNGVPNFSDLNLSLGAGAANPGLLAALARGQQLGTATIHVRDASGQAYLTYTLSGATVSALGTSGALGTGPMNFLALGYTALSETFSPTNLQGGLSKPQLFSFNRATDMFDTFTPSTTIFGPSVIPSATSAHFAVSNPAPVLTSLSQSSVYEGSGDLTLSATGTGFVAGSVVQVNGQSVATTYVSPTQLTAVIPSSYLADQTSYLLAVANPTPGGGVSGALPFSVLDVTPTDSITGPSSAVVGQPTTFTLSATDAPVDQQSGFTFSINWGDGSPGQSVTGASGIQVSHTFKQASSVDPTGAILPYQVQATATDVDGTSSTAASLNVAVVNPVPVLSSLSQTSVNEGSSDLTLTVNGSSFVNGSQVQLNGKTLATTFVSTNQLTAIVPANVLVDQANDVLTVSNPTPGGGTSGKLAFSVLNVAPTASLTGPTTAVPGQPRTYTLLASDPSPVDQAAGFTFTINWGDGSPVQTVVGKSGVQVNHVFMQPGLDAHGASIPFSVQLTATDKDGAAGQPTTLSVEVKTIEMQGGTLVVGDTTGKQRITLRPADTIGGIEVRIDGHSQGVYQPTSQILIYAEGADDTVRLKSRKIHGEKYFINVPAILIGGDGNVVLDASGSQAATLLMGGSGHDTLIGGAGATILIGGGGKDDLTAGTGETILIGGTTDYGPSTTKLTPDQQLQALDALLAEWSRTDLHGTAQQTYQQRVNDLLGPNAGGTAGGLNGNFFLNATTVHDDAAKDVLSGDVKDLDWFFASSTGMDSLTGQRKGDDVTLLSPAATPATR